MRLVFLGDISVEKDFKMKKDFHAFKEANIVLANLEGPIVSEEEHETFRSKHSIALHNSEDVLQILKFYNIKAACFSNNHIFDFPVPLQNTKEILRNTGIESFGAGTNLMKAGLPFIFSKNNTTVKIFGFG
jgi:Bacterial capsule synthesis protein PGA_cap